ncbi:MAG: histidine phosphatase family protein [Candidatus Saccharibacteria bacterium]|nr:histidine phosphatase family protein [Candidatus Saccharibacteria bacterium]
MKITFIRHSKTAVKPEVPITLWGLSDAGIEKAHELGKQEAIQGLNVIYSSLQTKAIETMLYLAKPNIIPMRTHKDLTEITSFTNKFITGDEYLQQIEQYYARTLERIAGGETVEEALARFEAALEAIVNSEPEATNIGIVTHGYILSFFTGKYSNLVPFDLHHSIQQPDVAEFDWESKTFTRLWSES